MALGRPLSPLSLSPSERQQLLDWTRRPKTAQALALRARIVLSLGSALDCSPTSNSAKCPTKTWRPSWFLSAACRQCAAICPRQGFRSCSPALFRRYRNP